MAEIAKVIFNSNRHKQASNCVINVTRTIIKSGTMNRSRSGVELHPKKWRGNVRESQNFLNRRKTIFYLTL